MCKGASSQSEELCCSAALNYESKMSGEHVLSERKHGAHQRGPTGQRHGTRCAKEQVESGFGIQMQGKKRLGAPFSTLHAQMRGKEDGGI